MAVHEVYKTDQDYLNGKVTIAECTKPNCRHCDHPKVNAVHYGLEPCDIPDCAWCEKGAPHGTMSPLADVHVPANSIPQTIAPNRFDPYEALDTIFDQANDASGEYHMEKTFTAILALRAYITGMER